jgi:hypothetical protein
VKLLNRLSDRRGIGGTPPTTGAASSNASSVATRGGEQGARSMERETKFQRGY